MRNPAFSALLLAVALALPHSPTFAAEPFVALGRQEAKALADPGSHSKPTIVALWSSDCSHCKKNLQLFSRMVKADPRIKLITLATERPSAGLGAHLDKFAVPGQRLAYGEESPEALAFALDPKWRGELPRTLFFDSHGGKVVISGVVDRKTTLHHLGLSRKAGSVAR
jgi:thiol-disulfide isomerase/thioredoxin